MLLNVSERLWIFIVKENYSNVFLNSAMFPLKLYFEANFSVEV